MNRDTVLKAIDDAFAAELSLFCFEFESFKDQYGETPLGNTPLDNSIVDIMLDIEERLDTSLPADDEDTLLLYSYYELREKVCEWLRL